MEWVIVGVIWWHTIWVVPCHLVCPPLPLSLRSFVPFFSFFLFSFIQCVELLILLPPLWECWDYGNVPQCLAAWGPKCVEESLAWGLASHRRGDSVVLRLRSHAMVFSSG